MLLLIDYNADHLEGRSLHKLDQGSVKSSAKLLIAKDTESPSSINDVGPMQDYRVVGSRAEKLAFHVFQSVRKRSVFVPLTKPDTE